MSEQQIAKIAIIGSGKLGTDIFYYLADFDFDLLLVCIDKEEADKQNNILQKKINRQFKAGIIDEGRLKYFQNAIIISNNYEKLAGCDLIIECIWEDKMQKQNLFKEIAPFVNDRCILASNSSSINPSLLTQKEEFRERIIGLHFFYPVRLKNIVEVIKSAYTSGNTLNNILSFTKKIGKKHLLQDESNSFVMNKLFLEVQNEAYNIFCEGVLSYSQIDRIVDEHLFPGGIFRFFDQVGNDIMLQSIKNYIPQGEREPYTALIVKLKDLCSHNLLGIKTSAGFYDYQDFNNVKSISSLDTVTEDYMHDTKERLINVYFSKAQQIVDAGIVSKELLEFAAKEYMNADNGPFSLFTELSTHKM